MMTKEGYNKIVNLRTPFKDPQGRSIGRGKGGGSQLCIFLNDMYLYSIKKIAIALRGYNAAFLFCDGPVDPF